MAKIQVDLHTVGFSATASVRKKHASRARRLLKRAGFTVGRVPGGFAQTSVRVSVVASNCDAAHYAIIEALKAKGMKQAARLFTTTNCVRR